MRAAAVLLALMLAAPLAAQRGLRLPRDTAVHVDTLPNGVVLVVRAHGEPPRRAELRLVVRTGSLDEREDERGLAHLVEHLAFRGTRRFSAQALEDTLAAWGMRLGPEVNATTGYEETIYQLAVPLDRPGALATAIDLLVDWATGVRFPAAEVRRERAVVLEEWRLGRGPGARLQERHLPWLLAGSLYAARPPIGDTAVVARADSAALARFYARTYRPERTVVVAVGDFDPGAVRLRLRRAFGAWFAHEPPPPPVDRRLPRRRGTALLTLTDPEATVTTLTLLRRTPARRGDRVADFAAGLETALFHELLGNRLFELADDSAGPVLDVSTYAGPLVGDHAVEAITATVAAGRAPEALARLLAEVARVARDGFTATEWDRARREMLQHWRRWAAERRRAPAAQLAAELVAYALEGGPLLDPTTEIAWVERLLPRLSTRGLRRRAAAWLRADERFVLVTGPSADPPPDTLALRSALRRPPRLTPYRDSVPRAELAPPLPPGRVVAQRQDSTTGVVEWRLSNGARVVVLPTPWRDDEVLFAADSPGGALQAPDSLHVAALTAGAIVQLSGAGPYRVADLVRRLSGHVASVGVHIDESYEGLQGYASPEDVPLLLQLVQLYVTQPRIDPVAVAAYRHRLEGQLRLRDRDPETRFADTLRWLLSGGHPRAAPLTLERLAEFDPARSLAVYRDRFADAGDFTFFFVGRIDPTALRPWVERTLAALPDRGRREHPATLPPAPTPRRRAEVRAGSEPRARTQLVLQRPCRAEPDPRPALEVVAEWTRRELETLLRDRLGAAYAVGVRGSVAWPARTCRLAIGFVADPERIDALADTVMATLARLAARGPSAADGAAAHEALRRARELDARTNGWWLEELVAAQRAGLPWSAVAARARPAPLPPESLAAAARAYLTPVDVVRVTLRPASPPPAAVGRAPMPP